MPAFSLGPPSLAALQHICRNLRARDQAELGMLGWGYDADAQALALWNDWGRCFRAQVASFRDEPAAIVMLSWQTPTTLNAALLATDLWPRVALPLLRHCRRILKPAVIERGVVRVECRTWAGHADARGFLEALGARAEVRLPGYGQRGECFVQYAWTRPDILATDRAAMDQEEALHVQDPEGRRLPAPAHHH